jgi:hypothetical protein
MRRLRAAAYAGLIVIGTAAGVGAEAPADAAPASVLGVELRCDAYMQAFARACAEILLRRIRARVEQDYLQREGLVATPEEVAELQAYNAAFERHDREQRTRKLAEIEVRLQTAQSDSVERERLLAFRVILQRLAGFEADLDAGIVQRDEPPLEALRFLIETTKLDASLHARYGGSVGIASSGPYAHGARAALIEDYLARSLVIVHDPQLAQVLQRALRTPPKMAHRGGDPDFTPYWRRPIPASYVAP